MNSSGKTGPGRLASSKQTADTGKAGLCSMTAVSTTVSGSTTLSTAGALRLLRKARRLRVCGRMGSRLLKRMLLKRKSEKVNRNYNEKVDFRNKIK